MRCAIRLAQWQRNLIGIVIAAFVSILGFNVAFPFLPLYVQSLGVDDPGRAAFWTGVIGSVAGLLAAVAAPVWGHLADRRGRRPMLVRATAGAAVGLVIMGLAPGLFVLLIGRIAFGVMAGTVPAANPLIAANTPPEHISSAMGTMQGSLYVSNTLGPLIGGVLASVAGFRATFLITAALYVASAVPVLLLVRERFTPPSQPAPLLPSMAANFRMVFRRADLVLPLFASFLIFAGVSAVQPVLPLYIAELVGDEDANRASGLAFGLWGVAGTVAAFALGAVTRRYGQRPLLIGGSALLLVSYLALWGAASYAVLVVVLLFLGVAQGLTGTTLSALLATRAPRERAGAVFGVVSSVTSFAFSGAPFLGGIAASTLGLRAVFPLAALITLGAVTLCLCVASGLAPRTAATVDASPPVSASEARESRAP